MLKGGGWITDPWQRCLFYIGLISAALLQVRANATSPKDVAFRDLCLISVGILLHITVCLNIEFHIFFLFTPSVL